MILRKELLESRVKNSISMIASRSKLIFKLKLKSKI
jgi:hypothetical protein